MDHPFKNFDNSKLKIVDRSNAAPATDTANNDGMAQSDEGAGASSTDSTSTDSTGDDDSAASTQSTTSPTATTVAAINKDDNADTTNVDKTDVTDTTTDTTAATDTDQQQDTTQQAAPAEYTEQDFLADVNVHLDEITQGKIKTPAQIATLLQENDALKVQLANKQLEFPSEAAKKAYEYAVKAEGRELSAMAQYFHVQQIDLATKSAKDKQFEAFALNRPDLTREKAAVIFNAGYDKQFADLETDVVVQDAHDQATREAEKKILAMQKEFNDAKTVQATTSENNQAAQQQAIELEQRMEAVVSEFGGISYKFGDTPTDVVNFLMKPEEVSAFKEMLVNPAKLLDRVIDKCMVNGKLDDQAYANMLYAMTNVDRLLAEARTNGVNAGKLLIVQDRKNTVVPKTGNGAAPAGKPKKNFAQTMAEAVKSHKN